MTTPPFFFLFGYLFHHPLFLISDHVQLFPKVAKNRVLFDLVQSMRGRLVASVLGCVRLASFSTSAFSASKFNSLASRYRSSGKKIHEPVKQR
jgi:hypothetical protein